jgi:hypothetical protein
MPASGFAIVCLAVAASLVSSLAVAAVPIGYRYVGSRAVSEGRVVYWYWNAEHVEIAADGTSFIARMFARAPDVASERPYVAVVRCDQRTYREYGSRGPFEAIDEGEPIDAVWRAGCADGRALTQAERNARLAGMPVAQVTAPAAEPATTPNTASIPGARAAAPASASAALLPPAPAAQPVTRDARVTADARRADHCVRFAETRPTPAGEATITNTCAFPVEVSLCYRGGGSGAFHRPTPPLGRRAESLAPGATLVLPDYRRTRHKGIASVACKGALGSVFPRLDDAGGKSGCE